MIPQLIRFYYSSNKDRHLVLKGFVEFAFVLMNCDRRAKDEDNQLYEIGIRILQKLIRKRHEIGATVLQKLTDRIVGGGSTISQYTGERELERIKKVTLVYKKIFILSTCYQEICAKIKSDIRYYFFVLPNV